MSKPGYYYSLEMTRRKLEDQEKIRFQNWKRDIINLLKDYQQKIRRAKTPSQVENTLELIEATFARRR